MTRRPHSRDDELDALRADFARLQQQHAPSVHPGEDQWVRFATGELRDDERDELADHLVSCGDCAAIYRAVSEVRREAAAFDPNAPRVGVAASAGRYQWLPAAAALVIAAAGVFALISREPSSPSDAPAAAASPPPTTAAPPSTAPQGPRAWAQRVEAVEIRLPAALALTVRGADDERTAFLDAFGAATAPYREGRYEEAATRLAALAERWSGQPEVAFYLGASLLLSGDPDAAIAPLAEARSSQVLSQEARWYEAVARERAGQSEQADAMLRELCGGTGPYQAQACAALKER